MRDKVFIIGIAAAAIIIGVLIFSYATKTASKSSSLTTETVSAASVVPFVRLAHGSQSAITRRVNYYITSDDELESLWKMVGVTGTPPTVDFSTQMVLAIFAGSEPSTTIAVAKVEDAGERMVSIQLAKPDGTCTAKKPVVSPYELVAVPATSLPLAHEDIVATTSCPN